MASKEKILFQRKLDDTTSSMTQVQLNDLVVSFRPLVKKARVALVHKLARHIQTLRKKKGNEKQVLRNNKKADGYKDEIEALKKLSLDIVIKNALANTATISDVGSKSDAESRVILKISCHKFLTDKIEKWRSQHRDWKELSAFMLYKNTSRRYKKIKKVHFENIKEDQQKSGDYKTQCGSLVLSSKKSESSDDSGTHKNVKKIAKKLADKHSQPQQSPKISKLPKGKDELQSVAKSKDNVCASSSSAEDEDSSEEANISKQLGTKSSNTTFVLKKPDPKELSGDEESSAVTSDEMSSSFSDVNKTTGKENNREMVVKKLDLSQFVDSEVISSGADCEDIRNVPFLFKDTLESVSKKKRDSFFWGGSSSSSSDDGEQSDEDSGRDTDDEYDAVKKDNESEIPAALNRDSIFIGSLSSGQKHQVIQRHHQKAMKGIDRSQKNKRKERSCEKSSTHTNFKKSTVDKVPSNKSQKTALVKESQRTRKQDPLKRPASEMEANRLHPSWAASKKRKEQSSIQSFQGKKITFEDDED